MDDKEGLLSGYNNLGRLFNEMKRSDEALATLEKAARYARQVGEEIRIGNIYVNMGIAYRQKGDATTAKECYREAEAIFRRFSHVIGLAEVQDNLGLVYLDQHQWPEARSHLQTGLRMWPSLGHVYNEIQALIYLAEYEVTRKKSQEAERWLDEAESLLDQHNRAKRYQLLDRRINELRHSLGR
jgi:tetratricopeptide (TPR) repeat protein